MVRESKTIIKLEESDSKHYIFL